MTLLIKITCVLLALICMGQALKDNSSPRDRASFSLLCIVFMILGSVLK